MLLLDGIVEFKDVPGMLLSTSLIFPLFSLAAFLAAPATRVLRGHSAAARLCVPASSSSCATGHPRAHISKEKGALGNVEQERALRPPCRNECGLRTFISLNRKSSQGRWHQLHVLKHLNPVFKNSLEGRRASLSLWIPACWVRVTIPVSSSPRGVCICINVCRELGEAKRYTYTFARYY